MKYLPIMLVLIALAVLNECVDTAHAGPVYNIPEGPASSTLMEWSKQSHIDIVFNYHLIRGLRTPRVYAAIDAIEALSAMLRDTGWRYFPESNRMVSIFPGEQPLGICHPEFGALAPLPPCKQRSV